MIFLNLYYLFAVLTIRTVDAFEFSEILPNITNSDLLNGIRYFYDNFFFKNQKAVIFVPVLQNSEDFQLKDLKNSILSNHQHKINYIFSIENYTDVKVTPYMSRNAMIILIDTYQSFKIFVKSLTQEHFNLRGYYLFVLIKGLWNEHEMKNFTSILWTKGITNFNIIYENSTYINFTSTRPFNSRNCLDLSLRPLNSFKDGKFQRDTRYILFRRGRIEFLLKFARICSQ